MNNIKISSLKSIDLNLISPKYLWDKDFQDIIRGYNQLNRPLPYPIDYFSRLTHFQQKINIHFQNPGLLIKSMTSFNYAKRILPVEIKTLLQLSGGHLQYLHPNQVIEINDALSIVKYLSNHSMSLLGRHLLSFIFHSFLYQHYPYLSIFFLNEIIEKALSINILSRIALDYLYFDDNKLLLYPQREAQWDKLQKISSQALLSFFAALYLDQGLKSTIQYLHYNIIPLICQMIPLSLSQVSLAQSNACESLIKHLSSLHLSNHLSYKIHLTSNQNENFFKKKVVVGVYLSDHLLGEGESPDYHQACLIAAENALKQKKYLNINQT